MSTFLKSFAKPFAAAVLMALAPVFSVAAPLLANPELPAEPVALFKLASKKSAKPAPDYLVGTVGVELFVTELSSMKVGEKARMTLPNGVAYEIVLDRIDRHAEGDFSWVGHIDGHQHNMPVVVTLGTEGTYGTIDTPEGRFGIIPGEGHDWLFDASMSTLWYDRPAGTTDAMVPDLPMAFAKVDPVCPDITAMPGTQTTIDVLFVMAPDFVSAHGGQAGASTRLNALLSQVNTYYANSRIATTLRRVAAINVNYRSVLQDPPADPNANPPVLPGGTVALNAITNGTAPFNYVNTVRQLYGADMVAFMRGPSNGGGISGVAWIGGYNQSPISGSAGFMYSVSGDTPAFSGTLFAHELGHNMGNLHDLSNLGGDPNPGATSYAKGWTVCSPQGVPGGMTAGCPNTAGFHQAGSNGFGTIMSYWRPTAPRFSSPNYTCTHNGGTATCGSPMGNATPADAVRSMNCTRAGIAAMRVPNVTDCANITLDTDGDQLPNCVESALNRVNGTRDNDIFASTNTGNVLFAMQQYRDFLGREGDADGLHFYMNTLGAPSSVPKPNVTEGFFNSPEFQGTGAPIVRLYFAFFNRIPDYPGLIFQMNAFRTGTPLNTIANNFSLSPEFQATYGALTNAQYVALLYQNVLGRTGSPAEINFHVNRLTTGTTRGEVMTGFSESPEYIATAARRVYVTMMYVGMLRRAPDQGGFNFYLAGLAAGQPGLNIITGFYNSPEYRLRFLP